MCYAAFSLLPDFTTGTFIMRPPVRVVVVLIWIKILLRIAHVFAFFNSATETDLPLPTQAEAASASYLVCDFAFGTIGFDEAMRSIELFATKVMPAFK